MAAIIATVAWGFTGLISIAVGLMTAMSFDSPGSENNPYLWTFVIGIWLYPVMSLLSIIGSWIAWKITRGSQSGRTARLAVALLPLLSVLVAIAGMILLQVKCSGNFSC